jgi:hypothetical protein
LCFIHLLCICSKSRHQRSSIECTLCISVECTHTVNLVIDVYRYSINDPSIHLALHTSRNRTFSGLRLFRCGATSYFLSDTNDITPYRFAISVSEMASSIVSYFRAAVSHLMRRPRRNLTQFTRTDCFARLDYAEYIRFICLRQSVTRVRVDQSMILRTVGPHWRIPDQFRMIGKAVQPHRRRPYCGGA